jgi:hypothetical protein
MNNSELYKSVAWQMYSSNLSPYTMEGERYIFDKVLLPDLKEKAYSEHKSIAYDSRGEERALNCVQLCYDEYVDLMRKKKWIGLNRPFCETTYNRKFGVSQRGHGVVYDLVKFEQYHVIIDAEDLVCRPDEDSCYMVGTVPDSIHASTGSEFHTINSVEPVGTLDQDQPEGLQADDSASSLN